MKTDKQTEDTVAEILKIYLDMNGADSYDELMQLYESDPEKAEDVLSDFVEQNREFIMNLLSEKLSWMSEDPNA